MQEQRLKISEIGSLNDPFDLLPFDLSDPAERQWIVDSRKRIGKKSGLLCFSQHWQSPVLWAHYAENHRGLCLGFDVPDDLQRSVDYVDHPLPLRALSPKTLADQMAYTKYDGWHYENEIRMAVTLQEKDGKYYYYGCDEVLKLVEIILGAKCWLPKRRILQTLGSHQSGILIKKVRAAFNEFKMVEDEDGRSETVALTSRTP
jgi:hypothetical protein